MEFNSDFFYKYWIEGSINDASITKIYQCNKLTYESSNDLHDLNKLLEKITILN